MGYFHLVPFIRDKATFLLIFYVFFGIIIFIYLLMIYIYYSYKKNFTYKWAITILKYLFTLFETLFYVPISNLFFAMINCGANYEFSEHLCDNSIIFYLQGFLAVLALVLFNLIMIVMLLSYFESRISSDILLSKSTGRIHLEFFIYKFSICVAFNFLWTSEMNIIVLFILCGGSIHLFYRFHTASPFFNANYRMFWEVLTGLDNWTSVMLVLARVIEGNLINGTLIIWLVGFPFIILIISTQSDKNFEHLSQNVNRFVSGEDLMV